MYFKYFRDLYFGYCQVLAVFRPVGTASTGTASTVRILGVPKYSQYAQYTGSIKYTSTICAPPFR